MPHVQAAITRYLVTPHAHHSVNHTLIVAFTRRNALAGAALAGRHSLVHSARQRRPGGAGLVQCAALGDGAQHAEGTAGRQPGAHQSHRRAEVHRLAEPAHVQRAERPLQLGELGRGGSMAAGVRGGDGSRAAVSRRRVIGRRWLCGDALLMRCCDCRIYESAPWSVEAWGRPIECAPLASTRLAGSGNSSSVNSNTVSYV